MWWRWDGQSLHFVDLRVCVCVCACVRACVVCSFLFSHRGSECCTKLMILLHDEGRELAFLHAVLGVFCSRNTM